METILKAFKVPDDDRIKILVENLLYISGIGFCFLVYKLLNGVL